MKRSVKQSTVLARLLPQRLQQQLRRLRTEEDGLSAVEFAMLLPLMLVLYLGAVELSQAIAADRKVTITARTIADLVSQVSSINNAGMNNALAASAAVMAPFTTDNLKVVVSSLAIDKDKKATVVWSDTLHGTARGKGSVVTLPDALAVPNSSLIWSEVEYTYNPLLGVALTGAVTLKDQIYMRPRLTDAVVRDPK
jgi:Flp pilus assembly protein TadG